MADYITYIDLGQVGASVEIEVEVDDEWMHDYVTNDGDSDWAEEHFTDRCDVHDFVTRFLDDMDDDAFMELVAGRLGVEK